MFAPRFLIALHGNVLVMAIAATMSWGQTATCRCVSMDGAATEKCQLHVTQGLASLGRIAIVCPGAKLEDRVDHGRALITSLKDEIACQTGAIALDYDCCAQGFPGADPLTTGAVSIDLLVDALRRYNADAVLFIQPRVVSGYPPIAMNASLLLVDTRDARVLASGSCCWSMGESQIAESYRRWVAEKEPVREERLAMLASPNRFAQYVAGALVRAIK